MLSSEVRCILNLQKGCTCEEPERFGRVVKVAGQTTGRVKGWVLVRWPLQRHLNAERVQDVEDLDAYSGLDGFINALAFRMSDGFTPVYTGFSYNMTISDSKHPKHCYQRCCVMY